MSFKKTTMEPDDGVFISSQDSEGHDSHDPSYNALYDEPFWPHSNTSFETVYFHSERLMDRFCTRFMSMRAWENELTLCAPDIPDDTALSSFDSISSSLVQHQQTCNLSELTYCDLSV